eukprot:3375682-Amphidinium_carterae.1
MEGVWVGGARRVPLDDVEDSGMAITREMFLTVIQDHRRESLPSEFASHSMGGNALEETSKIWKWTRYFSSRGE